MAFGEEGRNLDVDLRNKIFWGVFYSLVYGYLMVGLIKDSENPIDAVKRFPLTFRDENPVMAEIVKKEEHRPI